ncbi:MAG TPA: hypothetical protein VE891_14450 [Allosphingosinicella sp.]|nr:hypothetical protein [Allosphingosinicella sp.]
MPWPLIRATRRRPSGEMTGSEKKGTWARVSIGIGPDAGWAEAIAQGSSVAAAAASLAILISLAPYPLRQKDNRGRAGM